MSMDVLFFGAIVLIFVLVAVGFLVAIVTGLLRWHRNNRSPLVTVPAAVVAKRQETSGGARDTSVSTRYFVTFQVAGGERVELPVDGQDFGVMVEHDRGLLTHQGTRYKGFARAPQDV